MKVEGLFESSASPIEIAVMREKSNGVFGGGIPVEKSRLCF